jgi:hypothetical protein
MEIVGCGLWCCGRRYHRPLGYGWLVAESSAIIAYRGMTIRPISVRKSRRRKSQSMPKTPAKPTTAENLEAKFDAAAEVLDFFDLRTAKVVLPQKQSLPDHYAD